MVSKNDSILPVVDGEGNLLGTCFVVSATHDSCFAFTCYHVVNANSAYVRGNQVRIIESSLSEASDIALIEVHSLFVRPLKLVEIENDNNLYIDGYTTAGQRTKREKVEVQSVKDWHVQFQASQDDITHTRYISAVTSDELHKGYSGAPVLDLNTNSVVGMTQSSINSNTIYFVSSYELIAVLRERGYIGSEGETLTLAHSKTDKRLNLYIENLENALQAFSNQPKIKIERCLFSHREDAPVDPLKVQKYKIDQVIADRGSSTIESYQQFGLTSFGHQLALQAYHSKKQSWFLINIEEVKPYKQEILKALQAISAEHGISSEEIDCLIVDGISAKTDKLEKFFDALKQVYHGKIVALGRRELVDFLESEIDTRILPSRRYFLRSLDRQEIRRIVEQYNNTSYISDDDVLLEHIIDALESINIPRTPLNVLLLLKLAEHQAEETPVNWTELIERMLQLLFNYHEIPSYKKAPDVKDVEFSVGNFCSKILKLEQKEVFSREEFIKTQKEFCQINSIDIEIELIFDIFVSNSILVSSLEGFRFRFSFWIFYFAAHEMLRNTQFRDVVFSDRNYFKYPELIEFYTGIDRRRTDAVEKIVSDLRSAREDISARLKFPNRLEVYDQLKWSHDETQARGILKLVDEGVEGSGLPVDVKDSVADKAYNRSRPLYQSVARALKEMAFPGFMKAVEGACRALRNSEYVESSLKQKLLNEIFESFKVLTNSLLHIVPLITEDKQASIEGANFILAEGFSEDSSERFMEVITCLPHNIEKWFADQLYSEKMGSLILKNLRNGDDSFNSHLLARIISSRKPDRWKPYMEDYLANVGKNSYYLHDILEKFTFECRYGFSSKYERNQLAWLAKFSLAKHHSGRARPSDKMIKKVSENFLTGGSNTER